MFKLELSEQLTTVVLEALAAQPLSKSFDAFVTIRNQMAQQRVPLSTPATTPPEHKGNGAAEPASNDG